MLPRVRRSLSWSYTLWKSRLKKRRELCTKNNHRLSHTGPLSFSAMERMSVQKQTSMSVGAIGPLYELPPPVGSGLVIEEVGTPLLLSSCPTRLSPLIQHYTEPERMPFSLPLSSSHSLWTSWRWGYTPISPPGFQNYG